MVERLPLNRQECETSPVSALPYLRGLLAALALLGLVTAPLGVSAAERTAARMTMAAPADGMPCCPELPAALQCSELCAIVTVCIASPLMHGGEQAPQIVPLPSTASTLALASDTLRFGAIQRPPPRPPKA